MPSWCTCMCPAFEIDNHRISDMLVACKRMLFLSRTNRSYAYMYVYIYIILDALPSNIEYTGRRKAIYSGYIYIHIYYPLYSDQPITRLDSHHVIRQYYLFPLQNVILDSFQITVQYRLYWTVWKRGQAHPPQATSGSAACERLAVKQMKVPNVRNSEKREKKINYINTV